MATIDIEGTTLTVRFTAAEKVAGLLRDVTVPLTSVRSANVEAEGLSAVRGVRAPGLALPGRRKIGTWRGRGERTAVCVRSGEPALRVQLGDQKYTELLIGSADAAGQARRLSELAASVEG